MQETVRKEPSAKCARESPACAPALLRSCALRSLRDGVTLLELLIVIMIIGMLTAAALTAVAAPRPSLLSRWIIRAR